MAPLGQHTLLHKSIWVLSCLPFNSQIGFVLCWLFLYSVSEYICSNTANPLGECKSRYHRLKRQVLPDALLDFLGVVWREWLALPSGSRTSLPIMNDLLEGGEWSILFEWFPTVIASRLLQKLSKRHFFCFPGAAKIILEAHILFSSFLIS